MTEPGKWSGGRLLLLLVGGLLVLALAVQLLENVFTRAPEPEALEPLVPKLRRIDDFTIMIDTGFFQQSTWRLNSQPKEKVDAVYDCFDVGIEKAFRGAEKVVVRRQMRATMKEIQDRCMEELIHAPDDGTEIPTVPEIPETPEDS